jgi:hypothetical protein
MMRMFRRPSPYLHQKLARPLPTTDRGTVLDAQEYMLSLLKRRELCGQWQRACELLLTEADVGELTKAVELALFTTPSSISPRGAKELVARPISSSEHSPYDLVRQELAETIHLNETLGAPSERAMEKLFIAIEAEEARKPRRRRVSRTSGQLRSRAYLPPPD